ncbi:DUF6879 family protein [Streptomyces sp. NPDC052023]|uniref:DUF6879 family protein n=1 Tax=Streptomyces sp. NPDC052023 TaxID=3365681 RepID=UPI0037D39986
MLRGFQSEAWRLETLPQYLVPQEAEELEAFRAGKRVDPHAYSSAYTEDLKRLRGEGKSKGRVHVLTRPLSCPAGWPAGRARSLRVPACPPIRWRRSARGRRECVLGSAPCAGTRAGRLRPTSGHGRS